MAGIELMLALYKLESFMIRMQDEFGSHKVVPPILQRTDKGIELLVLSGVLSLGFI